MKRILGLRSLAILVCAVLVGSAFVAGCGKSDSSASAPSSESVGMPEPGGAMPAPAGAYPAGGMPAPGGMPGPSGMPGPAGPGMPGAPPGSAMAGAAPAAGAAAPAAPARTSGPRPGSVPFEKVALKSPVARIPVKQGGRTFEFLRFKYADWDGKVCQCEMPASEAKQARLPEEWISTFDLYKQDTETSGKTKKKEVRRLTDFPFVSPPPAEQPRVQPGSGYEMPGAGGILGTGSMPAPGSGSMPAPGAMPPPGGQRPPGY